MSGKKDESKSWWDGLTEDQKEIVRLALKGLLKDFILNPRKIMPFGPGGKNKASKFFGLPRKTHYGEVTGWRAWRLGIDPDSKEARVKSLTAKINWDGPVMTTNVLPNGKLADVALNNKARYSGERGDYGVYAFKTPGLLIDKCVSKYRWKLTPILGRVGLREHAIEHELGYRAKVCVIRELWIKNRIAYGWTNFTGVPKSTEEIREELKLAYDCDVHLYNDYLDWASDRTNRIMEEERGE